MGLFGLKNIADAADKARRRRLSRAVRGVHRQGPAADHLPGRQPGRGRRADPGRVVARRPGWSGIPAVQRPRGHRAERRHRVPLGTAAAAAGRRDRAGGRAASKSDRARVAWRLPAARAYGVAAAFLAAATLVSALVGAADLNPLATMAALADQIPFVHLPSSLQPAGPRRAVRHPAAAHRAGHPGRRAAVRGRRRLPGRVPQPAGRLGHARRLGGRRAGRDARDRRTSAAPGRPPSRSAAFVGSLAGVTVAYLSGAVGRRPARRRRATLLLAGVAVGLFLTAVQTLHPAALRPRTCSRSTPGCSARCPARPGRRRPRSCPTRRQRRSRPAARPAPGRARRWATRRPARSACTRAGSG